MTVLSGQSIRRRQIVLPHERRARHVASGMTWGEGPAGYDVRVAEELFLPPGVFSLASTVEQFDMPSDVIGFVHDKSTLARLGLAVQNTVIEPGWRGYLTLELTNHGHNLLVLGAGQPIAQVVFHLTDEPAERPYAGRYQDQEAGPQPARLLCDEKEAISASEMTTRWG